MREAALRLALERGPDQVRVDDIAAAAGVSPRTYNNYFASREQAIVAAVTAEREARVAAAVAARDELPLAAAVVEAIVEQYTDPGERGREALVLITTNPALREAFLGTTAAIEHPLAAAIGSRLRGIDANVAADPNGGTDACDLTARVLAASVAAAIRVALERWVTQTSAPGGFVVLTGSLPELLRAALAPLEPALAAAE
ncbi:TetR/AcrR family transcriptional regulator [Nocardia sp. GAS34]|uniref:TetR/AcrR family transcriptional regulator n=1 Tax=unclassified Nocardia TaxID=2637762 RepID=UPI003D1B0CC5